MKYSLIHNNIIKVGPRTWHPQFFKKYLKEVGHDSSLIPNRYTDSDTPIEINSDIRIIPTNDARIPPYHPITEQLSGPFWDEITDDTQVINGEYGVADRPISASKNTLKELVASIRYDKENVDIPITVQEDAHVTVSTRRGDDRNIWLQSLILLPDEYVQQFKFPNEGIWLDLTKSDIQDISLAIVSYVQSVFKWENYFVSLIDACTNKQELESVYNEIIEFDWESASPPIPF